MKPLIYPPKIHVNWLDVVTKNHQPGKWQLIMDFSHPWEASVNDGVEQELCFMNCTSGDRTIKRVLAQGEKNDVG